MVLACAHYNHGERQHDGQLTLEEAAARVEGHGPGEFVWIGMHEPAQELIEEVGRLFGIHELALEDATMAHQRPKLEDYGDSYFVVLRSARYDEEKEQVHFGEIHLFLGPGYVITIRQGEASELTGSRERLEARPELLKLGPAVVVWAIVDKVVDDYAPVADGIEDDIGEVETDVFDDEEPAPTSRIYFLKREVIEFYRAVAPLIVPLESLEEGAFTEIPDELRRYFRDVADHARRIIDQIVSQREMLTSVLEANLALVSVSQNEIVKKISSYAAIIAVPTFIASIYGMNFDHMPELHEVWGYPASLATMAVMVFVLYRYFKRVNWI
jgi:magnesium transporter